MYDCAALPLTKIGIAIGLIASAIGALKVCSLQTIESDVVVDLPLEYDDHMEQLAQGELGWKISSKLVRFASS